MKIEFDNTVLIDPTWVSLSDACFLLDETDLNIEALLKKYAFHFKVAKVGFLPFIFVPLDQVLTKNSREFSR